MNSSSFTRSQDGSSTTPLEILTSQLSCAVEALGKASVRPRDVAAIGITNQRETIIVWERATGKPIHPAIVWQDRRTASACEALKRAVSGKTSPTAPAWCSTPIFPPPRWAGFSTTLGARARAERGELAFGTVDSWLIWHLTSGTRHVTDVTNASRTLLFNIVNGEWDPELLRIFGIPQSMLPEVVWSSQKVGEVTTTLGLSGVEIAGIAGDQQAALFGQLCWRRGPSQKHLRHRLLPPPEHRHEICALQAPADHHASCQRRAATRIRTRRQHLHRWRGGAVAARQSQADRVLLRC